MKRRRVIVISAALLLCAAVILLRLRGCGWESVFPPSDNSLTGLTETEVHSRLGSPRLEFAGHYGLPSKQFADKFSGQIKTLVFRTTGGDEYVSFEQRQGTWIAIRNQWLPAGGVF